MNVIRFIIGLIGGALIFLSFSWGLFLSFLVSPIVPILMFLVGAVMVYYGFIGDINFNKFKLPTGNKGKKCIKCGRPVSNRKFRYCSSCWKKIH